MIGPHRQRGADLALIPRPIVNASDAGSVAGVVVQYCFDDVGLNIAMAGHPSRYRSAQIVQTPLRNLIAEPAIKVSLACAPMRKAHVRTITE